MVLGLEVLVVEVAEARGPLICVEEMAERRVHRQSSLLAVSPALVQVVLGAQLEVQSWEEVALLAAVVSGIYTGHNHRLQLHLARLVLEEAGDP